MSAIPEPKLVARSYLRSVPAFSYCDSSSVPELQQFDDVVFGKLLIADGDASTVYLGNRGAYFQLMDRWIGDSYENLNVTIREVPFRANGWLEVNVSGEPIAMFRANPSLFDVERFFRKCAAAGRARTASRRS